MRITNQFVANSFLRQLNRNHSALCDLQISVSSGKKYQRVSENPVETSLAMHYKTEITRTSQYTVNLEKVQQGYDNFESALTSIENVLQRARELAVRGANDTLVQADRDAIAKEIDQLLLEMVDLANTDVAGQYIFAGSDVKNRPFSIVNGTNGQGMSDIVTFGDGAVRTGLNLSSPLDIVFSGNNQLLMTEVEKGALLARNLTAADVFLSGQQTSVQPGFSSELPPLSPSMQLAVLNSGRGMQNGIIILTDGNGIDHQIDLTSARRLEDVIELINNSGSFAAGIEDIPSTTAVALGLYRNAGSANTLVGLSDPAMQGLNTPLTLLNGGQGVPAGFLSIETRDGRTHRVDLSGAATVSDVLNRLNDLDGNPATTNPIQATFDVLHQRLEITDLTGGTGVLAIQSRQTQLYITDLPAHTAQDLGLVQNVGANAQIVASLDYGVSSATALLNDLCDGAGVEKGFLVITGRDGVSSQVDLTAAATAQDVINAIAGQTGGKQTATWQAATRRLVITDNTIGPGSFSIAEAAGTSPLSVREINSVVSPLGLLQHSLGSTILGDTLTPPGLTTASPLSSLTPPPARGTMVLRGADGEPVEIDLAAANTIGDVVAAINATGNFQATFDPVNNRFTLADISGSSGRAGLQAEEKTNTARDLGFLIGTVRPQAATLSGAPLVVAALPTLTGAVDLNPAVERDTMLTDLNSGRSMNQGVNLGVIRITDRAGQFAAIDLRGATTVGEVLDRINDPANGIYLEARINAERNGIELIDKNQGAIGPLQVIDVDSSAAADLGIAGTVLTSSLIGSDLDPAVTGATRISSLRVNEGGVPLGKIYLQSGEYSGEIDLAGVQTVAELIDRLSGSDNRFNLTAWIDPAGKRLNLSNTKGQSYIKVRDLGDSDAQAASALGLSAPRSIFSSLIDLRDNLLRNDATAISEQSIRDISDDIERVLNAHAEIGAKTNRTEAAIEKQEKIILNLMKMLDLVENVDMSEAITHMTMLETSFRAALQTGATVLQTTLMDFLR